MQKFAKTIQKLLACNVKGVVWGSFNNLGNVLEVSYLAFPPFSFCFEAGERVDGGRERKKLSSFLLLLESFQCDMHWA